jgi:hypothetical protein
MTDTVDVGGATYDLIVGTTDDDTLTGTNDAGQAQKRPVGDIIIGLEGDDTVDHSHIGNDIFVFRFNTEVVTDPGHDIVVATFDLTPPGANADWKAWENYENRLKTFFDGDASTVNSYAYLKAQGYAFGFDDAKFAAMKCAFDKSLGGAYDNPNDDGHSYQLIANPNAPTLSSGKNKIANTNGNDITNHQIDNNLSLATALGQAGKAAFITFEGLTGTLTEHVAGEQHTVVSSTDGNDKILDFDVNSDHLAMDGVDSEAFFKEHFNVAKGGDINADHVLTIATADNDSWSVQLKLISFDHVGDPLWNSFVDGSDAFETWAWNTLVTHVYDGPIA